jgi:hypothetical protein
MLLASYTVIPKGLRGPSGGFGGLRDQELMRAKTGAARLHRPAAQDSLIDLLHDERLDLLRHFDDDCVGEAVGGGNGPQAARTLFSGKVGEEPSVSMGGKATGLSERRRARRRRQRRSEF